MVNKNIKKIYVIIFLSLLLFFQAVDFLFYKYYGGKINTQIIFGLYLRNYWAVILSIIAMFLLFYFAKINNSLIRLFSITVLAGALSNILDRIFYGGVVDYLNFFSIPTFNLADTAIVIGMLLFLYDLWRNKVLS